MTKARAVLLTLAALLGIGLAMPATASASASTWSAHESTYKFNTSLTGRTTFQVGPGGVDVWLDWSGGPTETVRVTVVRQGFLGIVYLEGSCYLRVHRYGWDHCHIDAPASDADHVLYFSKRFDRKTIRGTVNWS